MNKATGVRVYMTSPCGDYGFPGVFKFDGYLRVKNSAGQIVWGPFKANKDAPIELHKNVASIIREKVTETLNFGFGSSPSWDSFGNVTLEAVGCRVQGPTPPPCPWTSGTVFSQPLVLSAPLRSASIAAVPINYQFPRAPLGHKGTPEPTTIQQAKVDRISVGVWPFGQSYTLYPAQTYDTKIPDVAGCGLNCPNMDRFLRKYIKFHDESTNNRGCRNDASMLWVRSHTLGDEPFNGRYGITLERSRVSASDTTLDHYRKTYAHELGHNLLGFDEGSGSIPSETPKQVGWDPLPWLGLDGVTLKARLLSQPAPPGVPTYFDVMAQGPPPENTWVREERYREAILKSLPYGMSQAFCLPVPTLNLTVLHDPATGWSLGPAMELRTREGALVSGTEGLALVRMLDVNGVELHATRFDLGAVPITDTLEVPVELPHLPNAHTLEFYWQDNLESTKARSSAAPQVTIDHPLPGQLIDGSTIIQWHATDADSDPMYSTVLYSHDGKTYVPLAIETTSTQLPFVEQGLPAATAGKLIVKVTDGFNTTFAEVGNLSAGTNHAPEVAILSPVNGDVLRAGSGIQFWGSVADLEDGALATSAANNLVWSSSIDGVLGTGLSLSAPLSPGSHTITLTVMDSAGLIASVSIQVGVE